MDHPSFQFFAMKEVITVFSLAWVLHGGVVAADSDARDSIVSRWENAFGRPDRMAVLELMRDGSVEWPRIASSKVVMDAVDKGLRDRAVIVAKKTQAFVMECLTSADGLDPGKLMETALISTSMAEKVTKADGLVNAALSDGFVQLSVYCLARVAVTKPSEHGEIRRRWSEILGLKSPCSATSFLIRYVSDDEVVASQRAAIEQLGKDTNYQAAVFGVGDQQPDHGRKMAGSPAWRQLVETGRTQVLLRVVFPALLDFAASGNQWEFLSTADDAAFLGVLSVKASKYAFPLMQVRGISVASVRAAYSSVSSEKAFIKTVSGCLVDFNKADQ
jgi:hypothetical protein